VRYLLFLLPLFLFAKEGELLRVIDGDTLLLKDKEGFTICQTSFIDTPESIENEKFERDFQKCSNITKEYALEAGESAKAFALSVFKNIKKIDYEVTRVLPNQNPVCDIKLPKGVQVMLHPTYSEVMVEQGYALPFVIYAEDKHKEKLLELAKDAKLEKRGLWKTHIQLMECLVSQRYSLRSLRD
jgi:endonuclease YncB( thermonuclease family)